MKAWVITLGSVSSLLINENMQVINTEDKPIPGLYSCGAEAFAAIMEGNYQGSGVGLGYAFTSGYMAGEEAAKFAIS